MQMGISSTLPAQNLHVFQAKRPSFKCRRSPLNPLITPQKPLVSSASSTELTRQHLSNLEKILQKTNRTDPQLEPVTKAGGKGLLKGLNLSRIWPEMSAAEEMSPRHLNRLKRLLSKTMEYSPRNNLGSRWREYHGCNDWSGLLDPLDENLRREVVRYGEFVQAAYHGFHSNPTTSKNEEAPLPRHVSLPERSYKVTKSLYTTSSVRLPKWVDDLGWMTQRSSWMGFVAVCDEKREIQRMGRRDIVIALRGTATWLEWRENFRAQLVEISESDDPTQKVGCGFLSLHKTRGAHVPSLADSVVEEVKRLIEMYKGEKLSITITGHSLGAALSLLVADEISSCAPQVPPIAVFSFGGPRVGNQGFVDRLNKKNIKVLRIVNNQDLITKVPGVFIGEGTEEQVQYKHEKEARNESFASVFNRLGNNNPLAYSHAGTELRVDTKMSPYLKPNADVACCHDLEAYLHLVDGFLSMDCPFRSNAKRSLAKLIHYQKSNVKQLYTHKALSLNPERRDSFSIPITTCLPSPSR
ncbi:Phospholipase A1-Ibeta2 [Hibiscus syriacus]|uniref:Phospholipase A1-Ibeta2 n=1 Tax=Hibiscus syriacus TaxID=106335 RepID=A0A6A3AD34_HIBSY|nr:phospholipase A1-Ibeta2, chloroplastic-like [Hibiscus syriacus]KAE8702434.1 Phospholipase A1-Ibeta2 [Hibiscus syriacus]